MNGWQEMIVWLVGFFCSTLCIMSAIAVHKRNADRIFDDE